MKKIAILALSLVTTVAIAGNDQACAGKNQDICDGLGALLLAKGKLCKTMLTVTSVTSRDGGDTYRITCKETSTYENRITYTLAFGPGNKSYQVY